MKKLQGLLYVFAYLMGDRRPPSTVCWPHEGTGLTMKEGRIGQMRVTDVRAPEMGDTPRSAWL